MTYFDDPSPDAVVSSWVEAYLESARVRLIELHRTGVRRKMARRYPKHHWIGLTRRERYRNEHRLRLIESMQIGPASARDDV